MIAIAGAKGGCGKTVITAGLTEAFARREMSTIAIDADRQLPTLHLVSDVDRKPTISSFEHTENIVQVVHQSPREENAGVITAPDSTEQINFETVLGQIDTQPVQVVVDCPSGAGPDVVEPMSAADRIVVVTTGTNRSIENAKTTISLADRLHVPVAGILINKAETVPNEIHGEFDVPILGTIPEVNNPLENEQAHAAFDDIAAELASQQSENYDGRLSTGVEPLDDVLDGGVLPGSVIALRADSDSQSEWLLYQLTAARGTLYLTTERSEPLVRDSIESASVETGSPTIRQIDSDNPLDQASSLIDRLPESANLIIDTVEMLENTESSEYTEFLNTLVNKARETESLVFLHCLEGGSIPSNRSSTEHFSDIVFRLETTSNGGVTQRLTIHKSRLEGVSPDVIELDLTDEFHDLHKPM